MPSSFAGDQYLQVSLPDYEQARSTTTILLVLNAVFWILLVPLIFESGSEKPSAQSDKQPKEPKDSPKPKSDKRRSAREKKKKPLPRKTNESDSNPTAIADSTKKDSGIDTTVPAVFGLAIGSFFILALQSPYNAFVGRRVFMAPLFTAQECQQILDMAHAAAKQNLQSALDGNMTDELSEMLQKDPQGWQKARHKQYPTTDLNLVTDPFTAQDRAWLTQRLEARLAPLLERTFGIPSSSIRANDMFVVRYDAVEGGAHRQYLRNHTDDGDISFNVLLNQEFEGGGTRFWDRSEGQPFAHVFPTRAGTALMHSAILNHEGAYVTKGTRIILVGFLAVDYSDPFDTSIPTGLSWQASWGSWAWLANKFKDAYGLRSGRTTERTNTNIALKGYLLTLLKVCQRLGDVFSTHTVEELVSNPQADKFLETLDKDYKEEGAKETGAVWWQGQNIRIDLRGNVADEWETRKIHKDSFADL